MPTTDSIDIVATALAEPRRRDILWLIRDGERAVGDIASHFAVTRPAISQHLKVLHAADLVSVRVDGNRRLYRARPEGFADLRRWMESFWRTSLATLKVEVEREVSWSGVTTTDGVAAPATDHREDR